MAAAQGRLMRLSTSSTSAAQRLKSYDTNYAAFILNAVERTAKVAPTRVAITDGSTGSAITYGDLPYRVGAATRGLAALGVQRGSIVCLHLPNSPEFMVAFQAIAALGAVATTSNPLYSVTELAHQLRNSGAQLTITIPALSEAVRAAAKEAGLTSERSVAILGEASASFLSEAGATAHGPRALPQIASVDGLRDVFALPYSSGTTGLPKGVRLSHSNLNANIAQVQDGGMAIGSQDTVLGVLPFYHIYGITCLMGSPLFAGASLITLPRFDPSTFLTTIAARKVSFLFIVPPIIAFLAKHPSVAKFDMTSIKTIMSGAAPLDAELQSAAEARFPSASVRQGYGMTESAPVTHAATKDVRKYGSVGPTLQDTVCRIVDPMSGAVLGKGKDAVGELQIQGPQVMLGYHNNDKATAETLLPGGWLRTGDLGYEDEDGHFFVVDRLKELIKSKGFQVAPAELEGLLMTHPLIYDAAVVGRADERSGEVPVAFVVTKATMLRAAGNAAAADALPPLTAAAVMASIESKVAEYKRLASVTFVDVIPKSPAGKILRRVLRDRIAAEAAAAKAVAAKTPAA